MLGTKKSQITACLCISQLERKFQIKLVCSMKAVEEKDLLAD
jgi:hypothetical protein